MIDHSRQFELPQAKKVEFKKERNSQVYSTDRITEIEKKNDRFLKTAPQKMRFKINNHVNRGQQIRKLMKGKL